jgi:hypothetical protein
VEFWTLSTELTFGSYWYWALLEVDVELCQFPRRVVRLTERIRVYTLYLMLKLWRNWNISQDDDNNKILRFYGGECLYFGLLGGDTAKSCRRIPTFRRIVLSIFIYKARSMRNFIVLYRQDESNMITTKNVPPKRRYQPTGLHDVTIQKTGTGTLDVIWTKRKE